MQPETRYARSGDVHIAYQVVGDGPLNLVYVPPHITHLDTNWTEPYITRFNRRLASFARLILIDKRGMGMSDRVAIGTLEERMDDVRAVMDAASVDRAALLGMSEGGPMTAAFAATYPERTVALVLYGTFATKVLAPDYPWGHTREEHQKRLDAMAERIGETWGRSADVSEIRLYAPSLADDEPFRQWWVTRERIGASPGAVIALMRMNSEIDIRHVLPTIRVPTLVLHRTGDLTFSADEGRYLAERIPGARFVELPGNDHIPWAGDADSALNEIEEFLTGTHHVAEADRVLATVLFTDIVGSTEHAAALGDRRWRDLLEAHDGAVRREVARFRGREVNTTGDGFLLTFDGPARAIQCARAIRDAARSLGLSIRAGLHTGECEIIGDGVGGIAVHIGARVAAQAEPDEVLVSSTVKDLVAGSGLRFEGRGFHTLKGVPDEWRLFRVVS